MKEKNNKLSRFEFRLTEEEKEKLYEYCEKHDITMTKFVRNLVMNKIFEEDKRNG